jgi:glycosyltransferase involved in cell wall biosynthesis
MSPRVSVIIPTFNCGRYILAAVDSALEQTFDDLEVIVVDDGSTDETPALIQSVDDRRLKYIATTNMGPGHARNVGMKAASGEYIAFLDSDDLYLPRKLELQVLFMDTHPSIGMVSTEFYGAFGDKVIENKHLRSYHKIFDRKGWSYTDVFSVSGEFVYSTSEPPIPFYAGDIFKFVLQGPVLVSNTVLIRREVLNRVGLQNEEYRNAQEYELVVRISKHYQVAFVDTPSYVLRYHDSQISMPMAPFSERAVLTRIRTEKVFLQTVLDWACADTDYYSENKDWLDRRLSELHHCIGEKYLVLNQLQEAREHFKLGRYYDSSCSPNARALRFSYLPRPLRRLVKGGARRIRALTRQSTQGEELL